MLETPERNLSREHFQKGVGLLGKGNFSSAEEAFRDAVALCSEEHVYLIGLARAIYYNPSYRADGKLPILESIVERAQQLAPDDKRVSTLATWVEHARARA
jgi:cytochrome c-type biogenesis protein CcmH/NrfG